MSQPQTSEAIDHQQLRALLDELQRKAREPLGLLTAFANVREALETHFAGEESAGGFFDRVRDVYPERADALQREHVSLLASAAFIAQRATKLEAKLLRKEIDQFVELVRAHEIAEGLLYQDAVADRAS